MVVDCRTDQERCATAGRTLAGLSAAKRGITGTQLAERRRITRALFVFTPAEGKRLIGKAVATLAPVRTALESGNILIGHGSTNVYVAEEILGRDAVARLFERNCFLSGVTMRGSLCTIPGSDKPPILLLRRGKVVPPAATMSEMLKGFGRESVVLKGANAVDPEGNAAVMMAHPEGGTIGWSIGTILARGIQLIVPVGLEKLVPSVKKAVSLCGQQTLDYAQGLKVGLIPLADATVVTEIDALRALAGVEAFHVASGGNDGSEGAVTLVAEGPAWNVERAISVAESVKGEPPLVPPKSRCESCTLTSPAQRGDDDAERSVRCCQFQGMRAEQLPAYLRQP